MLARVLLRPSFCAAAALVATLTAQPTLAGGTGQPDTENRYPNAGAIVVIAGFPGVPYIQSSGVLIHPRVLLTAGHLTATAQDLVDQGIPLLDFTRISFGTDAFDPSTWVEIETFFTHPAFSFQPDAHSQDLGIIILKEPVDLPCAALPAVGLLDDLKRAGLLGNQGNPVRFLQVGYGNILEFPPPEEIVSDGLRRFSFPGYLGLENVWLLMNMNPAAGYTGTGHGDSGGPVFWRAPGGGLVLVALVSRGAVEPVAVLKAYRVDTAEALGFIDFVLDLVDGGWL
jgi:hypothetical protein